MARAVPKADIGQIERLTERNGTTHHEPADRAGHSPQESPPHGLHETDEVFAKQHRQETDQNLMESNGEVSEFDLLREENAELRKHAEELEALLNQAQQKGPQDEQQKDLEAILEEKSDVIRQLHLKIKELQSRPAAAPGTSGQGAASGTSREEELLALVEEKSDAIRQLHQKMQEMQGKPVAATPREEELLALHEELEEERRQLKEDEESLMQQMRQMEVQMSRERAEMARQRSELQRLHNDIRHELELASREAELRDRLQPLQRRHQEMTHRKGAEPIREAAPAPAPAPAPSLRQNGAVTKKHVQRDKSGLFKRLFGG